MTRRLRWLLLLGTLLISAAAFLCFWLPKWSVAPAVTTRHFPVMQSRQAEPSRPLFNTDQLNQFLAAAQQAESIADPLKRCLAYPDPPGVDWSKAVTSAYCHHQFDPIVTPEDARRLIQTGHAADLDRLFAKVLHTQSSPFEAHEELDRTFVLDFKNGSDETRALMDAWKRQLPKSPFALAASGTAYVQQAQLMRGSDAASETSQSSFESMGRLLEFARTDLDQAAALDPDVTPAYDAMVYAATLESDEAYAISAVKRGLAINPASYTLYARLVWMTQPKWGGSVEAMQRIIASAQHHATENPLLRLLLSERRGGEAYVEDCDCNIVTELDLYRQVFAEAAPVNMLMSAGWAARNRNSPALSVIYRSELLRFDPSHIDHREGRAFDLPSLGQSKWALSEGNALVALAPRTKMRSMYVDWPVSRLATWAMPLKTTSRRCV